MKETRLNKVLKNMEKQDLTQVLISDPASIYYLTGKWIHPEERMLVLYLNTSGKNKLFVNKLFPIEEDLGLEKVWYSDTDDPVKILYDGIDKSEALGIDKNWKSKFLIRLIELGFRGPLMNSSILIDSVRMIKDEEEINCMREASKINDAAIDRLKDLIPKKYSEVKLGKLLGDIYEELGADGYSFDPIIAYGKNASDPHHLSNNDILKDGNSVILDIGCVKNSYCSDMTRTIFYKYVTTEQRNVYEIVLEANKRAIEAVKPGVKFCDVDRAARGYIESKGYGEFFTHRTGHSIGIEIHDFGDVSEANENILEEGMIFSIEPGIYKTGKFGVRIEDLVVVTKDGCEILNKFSKDLIIIE